VHELRYEIGGVNLKLRISAPLDPGFQPAAAFNRDYAASVRTSTNSVPLVIGLERDACLLSRYETLVKPEIDGPTLRYVEGLVKFLLWARGGWKIYIGGPENIGRHIQKC